MIHLLYKSFSCMRQTGFYRILDDNQAGMLVFNVDGIALAAQVMFKK